MSASWLCSYIESLPSTQAPEVFGLSPNADTTKDLHATDDMLAALLATGEDVEEACAIFSYI
jgi:hypothetical protein